MASIQLDLGFGNSGESIDGLTYARDYVSSAEERELVRAIDAEPWRNDLSRRVQHYGWRYDYKARRIDMSSYLGPLPEWASDVAKQLANSGLMSPPDQLIVNEYEPGQGIASHTDCVPCFGPTVCMISLLSDIQMDFEHDTCRNIQRLLEHRSLLVMSGPARREWRHGIAKRRFDVTFGVRRARRISLTFRTVIPRR